MEATNEQTLELRIRMLKVIILGYKLKINKHTETLKSCEQRLELIKKTEKVKAWHHRRRFKITGE